MTDSPADPSPKPAHWTDEQERAYQAITAAEARAAAAPPGAKSGPPAGWYPHPRMAGTQRYWDGAAWTDHVAPAAENAARPSDEDTGGLITAGFITAILVPFVGFIIGVVLLTKGPKNVGAGMGCIVLSLIAVVVYASLITGA